MAFLVKDLVDRQIFGGVRLVAGVLNVSNPILWVNVMEILDTPRSLNEGELVVSTGYGLEDQSLHKDLIHQLKKRGVSGLAIQSGYYIDQIPEYIIEDANKEGLPVLELPERLSFSEILHVLMDQITENNLISRKLVQGLDTLRIALGKKLNISEKKLFEKEQQVYLFLICLTGKNSRDEESLRQGMGKVGSFLSSMSKTCIGETLPDGTGMFLAPFSDGEAFTDATYDFSIFLTFLSENEEINFYVGAQPLKESRDLPDCVKEAYDHICLLDRIGAKRGICTFDNRLLVELLGTLHQNEYSIVLGNQALQKLLDHDRYNHTGYVHTIRIYLAHNCNATKTAEHLYIHRHTLMKRLQNISALCGINFTDYYMRVYMSLAILIHDYFTY